MRVLKWLLIVAVLIQLVPYGHFHTNPPVTKELSWDSPETAGIVRRACYDCHSNQTIWPWYSNVAPVSWLVQRDVNGGRRRLNFSEWEQPSPHADHVAEQVKEGKMPPWYYLPMHPDASLSDADKQQLMQGAAKTLGPQDGPEKH